MIDSKKCFPITIGSSCVGTYLDIFMLALTKQNSMQTQRYNKVNPINLCLCGKNHQVVYGTIR